MSLKKTVKGLFYSLKYGDFKFVPVLLCGINLNLIPGIQIRHYGIGL